MSLPINHFYRFGEFTLDTDQRVLLREGKPLPLAPKLLETLLILVENGGRIVKKEELMNQLWPDSFVEESNLTYSIGQLRKTLGDHSRRPVYIETIPRRGYRFIANIEKELSGKGTSSSKTTHRFETHDAQSTDVDSRIDTQESKPYLELARQADRALPEKSFDAQPAPRAASISINYRHITVAAALVVITAILSFVFLKISNKEWSENKRADVKSAVSASLNLEKLTGTGRSGLVAISPDSRFLAYTQAINKESGDAIWLRQLASNTNVEIVPPAGPLNGLAFANSGEYLYFVRGDPIVLHRVSVHGGVPTKIVDKLTGKFSISADDGQIAFIRRITNRDGLLEHSLVIISSDGTAERTVFGAIHPNMLDVPVWSPDGRTIYCAYGKEANSLDMRVCEVSVADGTMKDVSRDRFFKISKMGWLSDKTALIMSARQLSDSNQLWRISYPGMEISQITQGLSSYLDLSIASGSDKAVASQATRISDIWVGSSREPRSLKKVNQAIDTFCWTPSGRLVYSSTASGNRNLWIMEPDGTGQRQLTNGPSVDATPAVTPDNRSIVFMSNRTGSYQVWRINMDGSNQIQLTSGVAKNFPAVSPDGKWVLYNTTDDWHLWKVSIDGGEPVRLAERTALYSAPSPDGKVIACVGIDESSGKASIIVLPFEVGQPLKRIEITEGSIRGFRLQWALDGKALIYGVERHGVTALIKQPLDGSRPEEIMSFDEDELFSFGYSVDGRFVAVTRGNWQHDVVLISDLNRY